ncbi:unnamed protein product [Protopolystoma xenopodis]|uniref:Uncharacterized protein n=1 Tax=Protopolystoma xenopodis TaxID=117903 RepID=A0A448WYZ4_9PLAT|nr:unnamed protein product [Protopolystoma xenopodis]
MPQYAWASIATVRELEQRIATFIPVRLTSELDSLMLVAQLLRRYCQSFACLSGTKRQQVPCSGFTVTNASGFSSPRSKVGHFRLNNLPGKYDESRKEILNEIKSQHAEIRLRYHEFQRVGIQLSTFTNTTQNLVKQAHCQVSYTMPILLHIFFR